MAIKVYKPNRAARKRSSAIDRRGLHHGRPWKGLTGKTIKNSGRGAEGKITVRHRGGGVKRLHRQVDFGQDKVGVPATVTRLEYDPNRSAHLCLLKYADGDWRYVIAWQGASVGQSVVADEKAPEKPGNRLQLKNITPGTEVHNVELAAGRGGSLFRSAGSYGVVMDVQDKYVQLKMPSSEVRLVARDCWATIGAVGNSDNRLVRIGSAGRNRRRGKRPSVRGKVMNPVDHPHGGGEGAQPIGLKHPKTKWGKPALGVKTRDKNKRSNKFILSRRKNKNRR